MMFLLLTYELFTRGFQFSNVWAFSSYSFLSWFKYKVRERFICYLPILGNTGKLAKGPAPRPVFIHNLSGLQRKAYPPLAGCRAPNARGTWIVDCDVGVFCSYWSLLFNRSDIAAVRSVSCLMCGSDLFFFDVLISFSFMYFEATLELNQIECRCAVTLLGSGDAFYHHLSVRPPLPSQRQLFFLVSICKVYLFPPARFLPSRFYV